MLKSSDKNLGDGQNPLIDGNTATFVWRGTKPPILVGDFTGWEKDDQFALVKTGPKLWTCGLDLPMDAYIEYVFRRGDKNIIDPLNRRKVSNHMGGFNNYFYMPQYKPTNLTRKNRLIPHGIITRHLVNADILGDVEKRTVRLYHPPVSFPVPLVVVLDGNDFFRYAHLNLIVDNLIDQNRIQPIALAFVDNGGEETRQLEYSCNEATLLFLMSQVLPLSKHELNLIDIKTTPSAYSILGASFGGLMAFYIGMRMPQVFGNVLCQSGTFSTSEFEYVVYDLLQYGKKRPKMIWMDAGTYDLKEIVTDNKKMQTILNQLDYPISFRTFNAGHNYTAWRNDIWRGLEVIYGNQSQ